MTATLRFGVYRGHRPDGRAEALPDLARLHSALIAAAGLAPTAVAQGAGLAPRPQDMRMLEWFESNEPDAIEHPTTMRLGDGRESVAYRDKGLRNARKTIEKRRESATSGYALAGPLHWWWRADEVDPDVVDSLGEAAAEVPYLGEVDSPVVMRVEMLETGPPPAALTRRVDGPLVQRHDIRLQAPASGRTVALVTDHGAAAAQTAPAREPVGTNESEQRVVPRRGLLREVVYAPTDVPGAGDLRPWDLAYLLPAVRADGGPWMPSTRDYVDWARRMHQALISRIGLGAPTLLTGKYPEGAVRPPNRLAIHIVTPSSPLRPELRSSSAQFLVLVPGDADGTDLERIEAALRSLRTVYRHRGDEVRVDGTPRLVPGADVWQETTTAHDRLWTPAPYAVADTRPPAARVRPARTWTADDALRVAIGHVWREEFEVHASGEARLAALSDEVARRGVRIAQARRALPQRPQRYVHRMNATSQIILLNGLIDLGDLAPSRAAAAIGQSRHLGGGLLVPVDVRTTTDEPEEATIE